MTKKLVVDQTKTGKSDFITTFILIPRPPVYKFIILRYWLSREETFHLPSSLLTLLKRGSFDKRVVFTFLCSVFCVRCSEIICNIVTGGPKLIQKILLFKINEIFLMSRLFEIKRLTLCSVIVT